MLSGGNKLNRTFGVDFLNFNIILFVPTLMRSFIDYPSRFLKCKEIIENCYNLKNSVLSTNFQSKLFFQMQFVCLY